MRVAILADPLDNQKGGVHVYLRELVHALDKLNSEHEYILIREKADPKLSLQQIEVPNIHLPIGYGSLRLFVLIPKLLKRLRVDAVFEPAHFGPFNLPANVQRVTMIHDLTPILMPDFHRWHSQMLQRLFLKRILRQTHLVLSNSQNTSRDLARVYPFTADKTTTILLGRDEGIQEDGGKEFLQQQQLATPYFLYVGTIEPRKNLVMLLQAFATFRDQYAERIQLVIVGQMGWKSATFQTELNHHPYREDVVLTGYVKHELLGQAYTHALALIYPSLYEGFGFPILEALSCGTNVICPNNSSLPEVGGTLAYYYPTHDAEALATTMALVADKGKEVTERAAAGPAWAAGFSWKEYAKRFDALFTK